MASFTSAHSTRLHLGNVNKLYDNIRTTLLTRLQQLNLYVPTNHKTTILR